MKSHIKASLLTLVILLTTSAGFSEEHEGETVPAGAETATQQTESPSQPEPKSQVEDTEAFVPTESISEDLSVPFPVDI